MTATEPSSAIDRLYERPLQSRRSGPLFNAFSYPTKIDPEALSLFIASHTQPGDTVLDVFAGSGTTGIAARLCEVPTERMIKQVEEMGLAVIWGPRTVVLYELSVVGALLAQTMCNPPDATDFQDAALSLVDAAEGTDSWMYEAIDPDGNLGSIRHIIWSEVLRCPACTATPTFWDCAVTMHPPSINNQAECPSCGESFSTGNCQREHTTVDDPYFPSEKVTQRLRLPMYVYGKTGTKTWQRPIINDDLARLDHVDSEKIPGSVPTGQVQWGDLHRSGYHTGIKRFHHFYTRRNLAALDSLWSRIAEFPPHLHDALKILVLSYNATHATLMSRIVAKKGVDEFVLTGSQTGVLYIGSLPVEKNIFAGIRRKISVFSRAFQVTAQGDSTIRVVNASSTTLDLDDCSVDYVLTDPPFGGFIPYAEVNQLNEAWLGNLTDPTNEAVVSPAQGKSVSEYGSLLSSVFSEVSRVMKPDAFATVVFHSSQPDVWGALGNAFETSGLKVCKTGLLDKTQTSFKQLVHSGGTRGDAVFKLRHSPTGTTSRPTRTEADEFQTIVNQLEGENGQDLSPQHLYSRYVARCMESGTPVRWPARDFYAALDAFSQLGTAKYSDY